MCSEQSLPHYISVAVYAIKEAIDQRPLDIQKVESLLSDTYANRNQVQKGFKQIVGCRIKTYHKKMRMEKAMAMLEEGRLTKKQIAKKCGYGSQSNLTRAFKEVTGLSPTEWLRNKQQNTKANNSVQKGITTVQKGILF